MDIQSVMPLQILVALELDLDRPADALEHAKTAARLAPKAVKVQLGLGKAALAMRDLPTARTALLAATALDPDVPESFYLLSRVYAAQGDQRSAEQALTSFKELREQYHGTN
jgi:predicted Zn-dependent protease